MVDVQDGQAQTEATRRRYDRIAPVYDTLEWGIELWARHWRIELWRLVGANEKVLELGVGTGKSFRFYPPGADVTAIDISEMMLGRAQRRAEQLGTKVSLRLADAQSLPFSDASFDKVLTTFVFCSVPDALQGLREAKRVLKQGAHIDRETMKTVIAAGFEITKVQDLSGDVVKRILARVQ